MHCVIRPEAIVDFEAIRAVSRQAFGGEEEARLVDALRAGGFVRVSLVAEVADEIVGHILFSTLSIATPERAVDALALAPLAVIPTHQQQGIGSELVREGLQACRQAGHRIVIVLGHPEFYPRFEFSTKLAEPLHSPFSGPSFMAMELEPGALAGVAGLVRYPQPFEEL